jgi:hypothetical protein
MGVDESRHGRCAKDLHAICLHLPDFSPACIGCRRGRGSHGICQPLIAPDTALSPEILAQYRRELVAEFEQYFRDVSAYIACLDAERIAILEEARDVTSAYADFLQATTKEENE